MSRESLRINWLTAKPGLAGGDRTVVQLAQQMARRGHQNHLIHSSVRWPSLAEPRKWLRRLRKEWRVRGKQSSYLPQAADFLQVVAGGPEPVDPRHAPDADVTIATWWPTMEWLADWPASKGRHVYYVQHHETHTGPVERIQATYRMPALKLVVASWLQRVMEEEYADPDAVLMPNALDWDQFDSEPRTPPECARVGLLYSRRHWKDMETAFAALQIVQRERPEMRVRAFGMDTPRAGEVPDGLAFDFELRPSQDRLPDIYQECSCWILTSVTEGFGLCGLEAAAGHCPVISTRCGGPEEYVRDGETGYLVDVRDPVALADRILNVLSLSDEAWTKMSAASYEVARGFHWDRTADILERSLYTYIDQPQD